MWTGSCISILGSGINKMMRSFTRVSFASFQLRLLVRRLIQWDIAFIQFPLAFLFLFLFLLLFLAQIFLTLFVLIVGLGQGGSFKQMVMCKEVTPVAHHGVG